MCPISYNIYKMKLNEAHFPQGTANTHFLDKPYQEINFKSHLNSVLPLQKRKNTVRFVHVPCDFISLYLCSFLQWDFVFEIFVFEGLSVVVVPEQMSKNWLSLLYTIQGTG